MPNPNHILVRVAWRTAFGIFSFGSIHAQNHTAQPTPSAPDSEGHFTTGTSIGRSVWIADQFLYFDLPADRFPIGQPAYLRIEYLDTGHGHLSVKYDSDSGEETSDRFRTSEIHTRSSRVDTGGFVSSYHLLENPRFANRQNGGNDFRIELARNNGIPFRIASVTLDSAPFPDKDFTYSLSRPWLQPYTGPTRDFSDPKTLSGKVMTGYQGWFAVPNDLGDQGWIHWSRSSGTAPSPTEITIDMWPWIDEYEPENVYPAGEMTLARDGRPAYVFSSRDPETVQRHFRWMREHDIDGAYLQRFVTRNTSGYYGASEFVLDNVRKAANREGRVWAIEYDISSLTNDPDPYQVITRDWQYLVNDIGILEDPRYLHENGKPVLFIWGFSVEGREEFSVGDANAIIGFFETQDLYLIAGVGSDWEGLTGWHNHYKRYDQLLAWMEPSLDDLRSQKARLDGWGMKILPHAWPGFSWHNLQKLSPDQQYTARNGGDFYWDRLHNAIACGADQIFLGMFDEYDEATAIMPMSDNHPAPHSAWGKFIGNEGQDPFRYLRLSAAARETLNGFRPLSPETPASDNVPPGAFSGGDATVYLGTTDRPAGLSHILEPDGKTRPSRRGGHECRVLETGLYYYFSIDDSIASAVSGGQQATIELEVYDDDSDANLVLQYDGLGGAYTNHPVAWDLADSGGWRNVRWNVSDAFFGNRQNGGSDFRIRPGSTATRIRRATVFFPEDQFGAIGGGAVEIRTAGNALEWSPGADAVGWRLYSSETLAPGSWEEVVQPAISRESISYEMDFSKPAGFYRLRRPARR